MKCNWKRFTIGALLASMPLVMLGCGSNDDPAAPATSTITGNAIKGPLKGGVVEIYKLTDKGVEETTPIGTGVVLTDGTGSYTVKFTSTTGPVIIKVKGSATATYLDEVTGAQKSFTATDSFRAVVPDVTATTPVAVTPITEVAAQQVAKIAAAGGVTQAVLATTIINTNKETAAAFGLTDILTPPKVLGDAAATAADKSYAAMLTLISQIVNDKAATGTASSLTSAINTVLVNALSGVPATRTAFATVIAAAVTSVNTAAPTLFSNAGLTSVVAAVKSNVQVATSTPPTTTTTTTTPTTPTTPNLSVTVSGQVTK